MIRIILIIYSSLFFLTSCKFEKANNISYIKTGDNKSYTENQTEVNSVDCETRLKEMIMSCGSGCALSLKEKNIELIKKDTYKVVFSQEMYINEQKSDEDILEYYFLCKGKIIEKIYDNETANYLDENQSVPTQKMSFEKYGKNLCNCVN